MMKKISNIVNVKSLLIIVSLFLLISLFSIVKAENSLDNYSIEEQETHNGTIVRMAQEIDINGEVNGDLYLIASRITINGKVNGNVYLASSNVEIGPNANIQSTANILAQHLNFKGQVGSGANVVAENLDFQDSYVNNGGLMALGLNISLKGLTTRDVFVGGDKVEINSKHLGNTSIGSKNIIIGSNANIKDLNYRSQNKANIINSSSVQGSINENIIKNDNQSNKLFTSMIRNLLAVAIFVIVISYFSPKIFIRLGEIAIKQSARSALYGIGFILFAIAGIILFFLIILLAPRLLIPFLALGASIISLVLMAPIGILTYLIARNKNLSSTKLLLAHLLAGAILIILRTLFYQLVPGIGTLLSFLIMLWSFGATLVLLLEFFKGQRNSSKMIVE